MNSPHGPRNFPNPESLLDAVVGKLAESIGIYTAVRDEVGRIVDFRVDYVNDSACRSNRLSREDQVGRMLNEIVAMPTQPGLFRSCRRVVETGEPFARDGIEYRDGDGYPTRYFDLRATKYGDGFVACWRDCVPRRVEAPQISLTQDGSVQQAIQDSEYHFRHILDNLFAFVGVLTPDGVLLEANRTPLEAAGIHLDDVLGKRFEDCYWWSYSPVVQQRIRDAIDRAAAGEASRFDIEARMAGGTLMPIDFKIGPLHDAAGRVTHLIPSAVDITQRKRAEEELRHSRSHLAWVLEQTGIGTWLNELPLGRLNWDEQTRGLFFVAPDAEPTIELFFSRLHPADREPTRLAVEKAIRDRTLYASEHRVVSPETGEVRWVRSIGHASYASDGTPTRFDGINYDITQRRQAEEELEQSRKDLDRAQRVGQIGSWRLDVRHNVLTWSEENYRIFGVAKEAALTYETFLAAVHPDDRRRVHASWLAALGGEPYDIEHRVVVKDAVKWVREKAYLEFDEAGTLRGGFGITQDITPLKAAEEALLASKDFADKVLNSSLNGLYIYDLEKRTNTFINGSYTALTGYTLEEINALGRDEFLSLFHEDDLPRIAAHIRTVQKSADEEVLEIEYRFKTKNGQWRWYLSRDRVFSRGDGGDVRQFMGTFIDITARKLAEIKLTESQQLIQAINRINGMVHATFDPAEIMQDLVREGANALGCETAAVSVRQADQWIVRHVHGLPDALVGSTMDDDEERHALLALQSRRPAVIEDAWVDDRVNRDHMRSHNIRAVLVVPLVVRSTPLGVIFFNYHTAPRRISEAQVDFAGQLAATASIALENGRLFHEHGRAVEALESLNETLEAQVVERTAMAERRSQDLRRLAAELSEAEHRERKRLAKLLHDDMQQLLLAIRLRLPMLVEADPRELKQHVERLETLVGECLSASRDLTQELSPPVIQHGSLTEVIEWLGRWFGEKHGLAIAIEVLGELPPTPEHVRVFFFQAVRELLANVAKHSGTMHARVTLSYHDPHLTIQVQDAGKGFDPITVESRLQRPEGFGLFNIRERLQALGGRLDIEHLPSRGACLRLLVPVAPIADLPVQHADLRESTPGPAPVKPPRAQGVVLRLLVADDHQVVRQGLVTLLNSQPEFEVVGEAADGEQAIRQAQALCPDAIVMDVDMPRMDGVEATRRIKRHQPGIGIVGLSLHEEEVVGRVMIDAGADAYISKHAAARKLVEAIRRVCRGDGDAC